MENTIPTNLIEKALALTGKTMEDMEIYERWTWNEEQWEINDGTMEFSYPRFYAYLLSPEFIEKYTNTNKAFHAWLFWTAIYLHQSWDSSAIISLLQKI